MANGRPGHLTTLERTFAKYMAATGDRMYAAMRAGYSEASLSQAASQNMRNGDVQAAIRAETNALLPRAGQVGLIVLAEVATDTAQKGSSRVAAAKELVRVAGVGAAHGLSEADLAEMPPDKIRELLGQAQRQLEQRMKVVSGREIPNEEPSAQDAPNPVGEASVFA